MTSAPGRHDQRGQGVDLLRRKGWPIGNEERAAETSDGVRKPGANVIKLFTSVIYKFSQCTKRSSLLVTLIFRFTKHYIYLQA